MSKNLLKTIQGITRDTNIRPVEKMTLLCLIEYYNNDLGYAYPDYKTLKTAISSNSNDTLNNTLKSLVSKGYITIEKNTIINKKGKYENNIYYVHKHLFVSDDFQEESKSNAPEQNIPVKEIIEEVAPVKEPVEVVAEETESTGLDTLMAKIKADRENAPVDSTGKNPMQGQLHISDIGVDTKDVTAIKSVLPVSDAQIVELFQLAEDNRELVLKAINYTVGRTGINNPVQYVKKMIEEFKTSSQQSYTSHNGYYNTQNKDLKFNQYEQKNYALEQIDQIERMLLGWDSVTDEDISKVLNTK